MVGPDWARVNPPSTTRAQLHPLAGYRSQDLPAVSFPQLRPDDAMSDFDMELPRVLVTLSRRNSAGGKER
jgi:hypothetical protein